jgi:S-formylglutathione hydrolase FrmB
MAEIVKGILPSRSTRKEMPYNVLLPKSYGGTKRRFAVLYLLHGLFGSYNNWVELTGLRNYSDHYELVIVTPEGLDSWYVDSGTDKRARFEKYILRDLISGIDDIFRTRARRESRGIAGNSMGGYGAMKLALKRPDLFAFAASTSGAFHAPMLSEANSDERWAELMPSINQAFGPPGSRVRRFNNVFEIAARAGRKGGLPTIFIDCGKEDSFLEVNRDLSRRFERCGIEHTYKEFTGGHDWDYWGRRIKEILKRANAILN